MMTDTKTEYTFLVQTLMADIRKTLPDESLRTMATEAEISASTLSRIDNGQLPDLWTFMRLCAAFDLQPGDYFAKIIWERKS